MSISWRNVANRYLNRTGQLLHMNVMALQVNCCSTVSPAAFLAIKKVTCPLDFSHKGPVMRTTAPCHDLIVVYRTTVDYPHSLNEDCSDTKSSKYRIFSPKLITVWCVLLHYISACYSATLWLLRCWYVILAFIGIPMLRIRRCP